MGEQLDRICETHIPRFIELFSAKNEEYGENAFVLGVKGQYADMHRKFPKLKRALWDDEPLVHEPVEEVLMDLIGHCFLTLDLLAQEK